LLLFFSLLLGSNVSFQAAEEKKKVEENGVKQVGELKATLAAVRQSAGQIAATQKVTKKRKKNFPCIHSFFFETEFG
jgi:hypothetical protein